ncbi:unnamed protein product [Paramecium octaurelia]|uniref:Uncharacterized protein n=1 Tax=Paramecium octaurelia TaxID=43137 RepID=A0A8S1Y5C4_PAROT|nr:unnamed protein product [Paramecium octaurelia]
MHKSQIQKLQSIKTQAKKEIENPKRNFFKLPSPKNFQWFQNSLRLKYYQCPYLEDLDAQIEMGGNNTHSQLAFLQTLINKSYENKFNEPRDSPQLCYASEHIFKMLPQSINRSSSLLLRSSSQGNVANSSQSNNKIADPQINKIKSFLEKTKTFKTTVDQKSQLRPRNQILKSKVCQSKLKQNFVNYKNCEESKNNLDSMSQISKQQISFLIHYHPEIALNQSIYQNEYIHINYYQITLKAYLQKNAKLTLIQKIFIESIQNTCQYQNKIITFTICSENQFPLQNMVQVFHVPKLLAKCNIVQFQYKRFWNEFNMINFYQYSFCFFHQFFFKFGSILRSFLIQNRQQLFFTLIFKCQIYEIRRKIIK